MRVTSNTAILLGLIAQAAAAPTPESQAPLKEPTPNRERAAEVQRVFQESWEGYYKNAFPHDSLRPVANTVEDDRNGWGVTPVDSLSTAIILRDKKAVQQILDFIPTVDFSTTKKANEGISVFETTIRYLGGLISAYDLLNGQWSDLAKDRSQVDALLDQAATLADSLSIAFNTTSGVPEPTVFLNPTRRKGNDGRNNIAEIGTLVLEWTRLSDLNGDNVYAELAQKAENHLLRPKGSPEAWPGLVGTFVGTADGKFQDSNGGWSGYTDSFYEYLIKMYLYDRKAFGEYKDRWILAADSTMKHLASHPTSRKDLTFLAEYNGQKILPQSGHLASFAGGNFIMGGVLLKEDKFTKFGIQVAESYYETYTQTVTGIGPEGFQWVDASIPEGGENSPPPADKKDFYKKAGFWVTSGGYILRPETMESIYYAYRVTGDTKYQDMAWDALGHIKKACRAGTGYAGIRDVNKAGGGGYYDKMQSFWLAETLKYIYLIFAEDSDVQFHANGQNAYVFNTEAHPFHIRG